MTKAEHLAIYRKAYNEGRLTWKEFEAFFYIVSALYESPSAD